METLIYDRTKQDIEKALAKNQIPYPCTDGYYECTNGFYLVLDIPSKAFLNAMDLNRIEHWTQHLCDLLTFYGYMPIIDKKTSIWFMEDIPYRTDIDRIRSNIDELRSSYFPMPDWREIMYNDTMNYEQMNAIEWDLHIIATWIEKMISSFLYSGEIYCGEV